MALMSHRQIPLALTAMGEDFSPNFWPINLLERSLVASHVEMSVFGVLRGNKMETTTSLPLLFVVIIER
jgi:hypothetical protein